MNQNVIYREESVTTKNKWFVKVPLFIFFLSMVFGCRKKEIEISTYYENITNDTLQAGMASIGIDEQENLYIIWKGLPWTGPYGHDSADIYFSMKPHGSSWSKPLEISGHTKKCDGPAMAVDYTSNVHIAWIELQADGYYKLFYRMRASNGEWQPIEILIDNHAACVSLPYLSADNNGGVHLTWCGMNEIMYLYKHLNGNWMDLVSVPCSYPPSSNPARTEIAGNGDMHLVFQDGASFSDIWYTMKVSNGTWKKMVNLSNHPHMVCWNTRIAINSESTVNVIWHRYSLEEQGIYYTCKSSNGEWSQPVCIFDGYGYGEICIDNSGDVHLFFAAKDILTGNEDIFYGMKHKDGNWTQFENVTNTPGQSGFGLCRNIVVDSNGNLHLIWEQDTGGENNWDILYKKIERRQ